MGEGVRVGLTLPTFVDDPEALLAVARSADATVGIDGVFTYDHVHRIGSGGARPALALEPTLGALAAETQRVAFGSLVARASLRRPAAAAALFDTVARVAPGRFLCGLGAGDRLSADENRAMGLPDETAADRLAALTAAVDTLADRGYPVWVGGLTDAVLAIAAGRADGWNGWNVPAERFGDLVESLRRACESAHRDPAAVTPTWGGLVELRPDRWPDAADRDDVLGGSFDEIADRLRDYRAAGAGWVIVAPLAPDDPANAQVVAEEIVPRLA